MSPWLLRALAALLLVAGAGAFLIGTRAESGESRETHAHEETGAEEGGHEGEAAGETVLGLRLENTWTAVTAVSLSAVAVAITLRSRREQLLLGVAVFSVAFAALDAGEVIRQLDGKAFVAAAAVLALLFHAGAGLVTGRLAGQKSLS